MDTQRLIETLTRNPAAAGALGGLAGSLLGSVLTGGKLKAGNLVKTGGLAAVGYVAWQAWQRHQAQKSGAPAPAPAQIAAPLPAAFDLAGVGHAPDALKVVQAMVAAARADGSIDPAERQRIFARLDQSGLSQQDQDQVLRLLTQPVDMDAIVGNVGTPEVAAEIYAAAALAVHPVSRAERAWLDMLAARLNLEPSLVTEIDRGIDQAQV